MYQERVDILLNVPTVRLFTVSVHILLFSSKLKKK